MEQERPAPNPMPVVEQVEKQETLTEEPIWRLSDFKGFVHFHSWDGSSCGHDRITRIRESISKKTGLEYVGFTEHVGWPNGEYWFDKIRNEFKIIDQLNEEQGEENVGPKILSISGARINSTNGFYQGNRLVK